MKYPMINEIRASKVITDRFYGYNHNLNIGDGEFYEALNLTSDYFPILATRKKRAVYIEAIPQREAIRTMAAGEYLCYIRGRDFIIHRSPKNETVIEDFVKGYVNSKITFMGAYAIIMPDRKYINILNPNNYGDIDHSFTTIEDTSFKICDKEGNVGEESAMPPKESEDGAFWTDTSGTEYLLKRYSASSYRWVTVTDTYIKMESNSIGTGIQVGDGLKISGIKNSDLKFLNGSVIVKDFKFRYLIVPGKITRNITVSDEITVERKMPDVDFLVESGNRLWGCSHKDLGNGRVVNEIYASKLGDFKNWNCFEGISTDSYAASVGSPGRFTGAISYEGSPIFFKENCMHKIYGNFPENFQIATTSCPGVQDGCGDSISIVNGAVYYKSSSGVCVYDGSLPVKLDDVFGEERYRSAKAGGARNKYYITMTNARNNQSNLFTYDTVTKIWHHELLFSNYDAFCNVSDVLYCVNGGEVLKIDSQEGDEKPIEWEAITGDIGIDTPDMKYLSRLDIRISMGFGTKVNIFIQYDSSEVWEKVFTMTGNSLRSQTIPIKPKRCDHFRLRLQGVGDVKIYSVCKVLEYGGDE